MKEVFDFLKKVKDVKVDMKEKLDNFVIGIFVVIGLVKGGLNGKVLIFLVK